MTRERAKSPSRMRCERLEPRHMLSGEAVGDIFGTTLGSFGITLASDDMARFPADIVVGEAYPPPHSSIDCFGPTGPLPTRLELPGQITFSNREQFETWVAMEVDRLFGEYFGQPRENSNDFPESWQPTSLWPRTLVLTNDNDAIPAFDAGQHYGLAGDFTQVQVAGIDESDIVETDGEFLYIVRGRFLSIVDIRDGDNPSVVSSHEFEFPVGNIYLSGNRLTVVTDQQPDYYWPLTGCTPYYGYQRTGSTSVTVLDISDPAELSVVSRTTFNGRAIDSRMVDGQLQLVMSTQNNSALSIARPTIVWQRVGNRYEANFETREQYFSRVVEPFLENVMPAYTHVEGASGTTSRVDLFSFGEWSSSGPSRPLAGAYTTVATIDASTGRVLDTLSVAVPTQPRAEIGGVFVVDAGQISQHVYSTGEHLFVLSALGAGQTRVEQFRVDLETGAIESVASTFVTGSVANQYGIDFRDGLLRLVTRDNQATRVTVLESVDDSLQVVGELTGLAAGNRLETVHFFGDRVAIATTALGRITATPEPPPQDLLVVVDLADPSQPVVLGQTTATAAPGEYMQPLGDGHVWTVSNRNGLQIAIYDLTDPASPQLAHEYPNSAQPGVFYLSSPNSIEQQQFVYDPETQILAVPVRDFQATRSSIQRLDVVQLDAATGAALIAQIVHPTSITRSYIIGDRLFAISSNHVSVHDLSQGAAEISRESLVLTATGSLQIEPLPQSRSSLLSIRSFDGNLFGLTEALTTFGMPPAVAPAVVASQSAPPSPWESLVDASHADYTEFRDSLASQAVEVSDDFVTTDQAIRRAQRRDNVLLSVEPTLADDQSPAAEPIVDEQVQPASNETPARPNQQAEDHQSRGQAAPATGVPAQSAD